MTPGKWPVPTDYVSNFFYQCHGGLKSVVPSHLSRKSHWGQWGGTCPSRLFPSSSKFPPLLDWPKVALTCCVYRNLSSDILMGSTYLKCISPSHPLTVSQLPSGYVFNSAGFSQPSLTTKQAYDCNMELARHVHTTKPTPPRRHYSNPGLKQIMGNWEAEGRATPQAPPPLRVGVGGGGSHGQIWGVTSPLPLIECQGVALSGIFSKGGSRLSFLSDQR